MTIFDDVTDEMLQDVSYTISYSPVGESWDSFHDYKPDKLFNTRNNLYSFKDGRVYKHNANNKCIYYNNVKHSCFITPVFTTDTKMFILNNLYLQTDVLNNEGIRLNKTFNRFTLIDSYQGVNTVNLVPFDTNISADANYGIANTRRVRQGWYVNKFRNKKANELIRNVIQTIDNYEFNDVNISNSLEGIRRFIDNYVIVILEYDNTEQHDFYIYDIDINVNPVQR